MIPGITLENIFDFAAKSNGNRAPLTPDVKTELPAELYDRAAKNGFDMSCYTRRDEA